MTYTSFLDLPDAAVAATLGVNSTNFQASGTPCLVHGCEDGLLMGRVQGTPLADQHKQVKTEHACLPRPVEDTSAGTLL